MCPVLIKKECERSSEKQDHYFSCLDQKRLLADAEKRLPIPKMLRLYPSDFWFDFCGSTQPEVRHSIKSGNQARISAVIH